MGVTGLWKLIEPCGKPVPVETLEGKILAIDISIWLHQVIKGFQDSKGSALPNAHLIGLFNRLCKLLYYRVKPIFVFDGCVPQLKRETIARRQQQRSKLNTEADRIQALLLQSLAKEKVVQQALGANAELLLKSPTKRLTAKASACNDDDDMFKLPELPTSSKRKENVGGVDDDEGCDTSFNSKASFTESCGGSSTDEGSSFDESSARHYYNTNLQAIDVKSHHFRDLPADVRHEILIDIKETRKQSSWGRLHELPSRGDDFSVFQMKRLMKRRAVQESLEEAEREMGGSTLTYAELQNIFTEEGILEPNILEKGSKQICSDEHTRYLLVRDLKKKLTKSEGTEHDTPTTSDKAETSSTQKPKKMLDTVTVVNRTDEENKLGEEFDTDLQLALAMSLEDTQVYSQDDYQYESNEQLKLNRAQRTRLQNAATGPARAYMIEYGGMNEEEVEAIMEKTRMETDNEDTFTELYKSILEEQINQEQKIENLQIENAIRVSDTDSDLEEVTETTKQKTEIGTNKSEEIVNQEQKTGNLQTENGSRVSDTDSDLEEVTEMTAKQKNEIATNESVEIGNQEQKVENLETDKVNGNRNSDTDSDLEEVTEATDMQKTEIGTNKSGEIAYKEQKIDNENRNSDTDSDLEEVTETTAKQKTEIGTNKSEELSKLEIVIDLKADLSEDDDIFADVFESNTINNTETEEIDSTKEVKKEKKEEVVTQTGLVDGGTKANMSSPILNSKDTKLDSAEAILSSLKAQLQNVKNINFDDIKIATDIIELSDDENIKNINTCMLPKTPVKSEIIEICDSDDASSRLKINSEAENSKTPQKNRSILEYYPSDYVIKRTPDKLQKEECEDVPKVTSPFFVNKTPKSSRKRSANKSPSTSPTPKKSFSKASKSLFENKPNDENKLETQIDGVEPINLTPVNSEDLINEAAQKLKEQKTEEELQALASDLARERMNLESERNRQDRMGMSISQRMSSECQELLRLFGVPYIVAPMEAEAQCAFLDSIELTNGTITDDSDIWLFGGRTVYKNFFAQNKHVLEFRSDKIENSFNCDRKKLIQLACLVGSDYTTGIHGIGAVTALEILASFSSGERNKPILNKDENLRDVMTAVLSTLNKFRDWWLAYKSTGTPPGTSLARLALQKKIKNIELYDGFPSLAVVEAYLAPKIDESRDAFSWGFPDVESIREYARKTFGWTTTKTNEILTPVLKRLNEKKSQATIRNYFTVKSALSLRELKVSKRVQKAIDRMSGKIENETPEKPDKPKKKRRVTNKNKQPSTTVEPEEITEDITMEACDSTSNLAAGEEITAEEPTTSKTALNRLRKRIAVNLHSKSSDIIPQRERDRMEMLENKARAAEVLKNYAKIPAKKKRQL